MGPYELQVISSIFDLPSALDLNVLECGDKLSTGTAKFVQCPGFAVELTKSSSWSD